MHYWDKLATYNMQGFEVIVDKALDETPVSDCFDESCYDIAELERMIDRYIYDWFILRVRVMLKGYEFGSAMLGGCLYKDASEVLTDGTAADLIEQALEEARREARQLAGSLQEVVDAEVV